jgi:hypothetical protein
VLDISVVVGGLAQGAVAFIELENRIVNAVAAEKAVQDQERALLLERVTFDKADQPVRMLQQQTPKIPRPRPRETFAVDLDDEIPF